VTDTHAFDKRGLLGRAYKPQFDKGIVLFLR